MLPPYNSNELGGEGEQRGGWTMARALIQLKQRQAREKEARGVRARAERVRAHREGSAAVVISMATMGTSDEGSEPRGAALWVVLRVPHARSEAEARAAASTHAYWHEAVGRPPGGWGGYSCRFRNMR